mmetsp:Transcript_40727/g.81668  ORF Transcript_40727/g.81668 Transcript_40727/m.81668 type:complete len:118 (+) Transcript_40727:204-557(+)
MREHMREHMRKMSEHATSTHQMSEHMRETMRENMRENMRGCASILHEPTSDRCTPSGTRLGSTPFTSHCTPVHVYAYAHAHAHAHAYAQWPRSPQGHGHVKQSVNQSPPCCPGATLA